MALSAKFGKTSLFITMTCNMSWPEITAQRRPLERAEHRPDVLCRVFKMKHDELINRIDKGEIFGRCLAYSRTIEFQKRGWPHAHMLVWIDDRDWRLDDPDDIDSVVWARIPDSAADPELFELMKKNACSWAMRCFEPHIWLHGRRKMLKKILLISWTQRSQIKTATRCTRDPMTVLAYVLLQAVMQTIASLCHTIQHCCESSTVI